MSDVLVQKEPMKKSTKIILGVVATTAVVGTGYVAYKKFGPKTEEEKADEAQKISQLNL